MTTIHDVGHRHHAWDNALEPAVEIESGDVVELRTQDASDGQIGRDSAAEDVAGLDFARVNPVVGPVFVKGARPGDVLEAEILSTRAGEWGWTAIVPGFGLLADEFAAPWLRISAVEASGVRFAEGITLPVRPFPGTIGVALPEPGPHSTIPPSRFGGNIDVRLLQAGATLHLPVGVEGALFSVGDAHAAMGDGEVCGTAVETTMEIAIRLTVRRHRPIPSPELTVPAAAWEAAPGGAHICLGVGPDLMEAARDATRRAIAYLGDVRGLDRDEAYALLSVAADLRIHEVVDAPNWVVGMGIPDAIFARVVR